MRSSNTVVQARTQTPGRYVDYVDTIGDFYFSCPFRYNVANLLVFTAQAT